MKPRIFLILALSLVFSSDCSAGMFSFMDRAYGTQKNACQAGFDKEYVKVGIFTLTTFQRFNAPSENIRIYIEGDGRAWASRNRLSDDPTPSDPIALELATIDSKDAIAYIARPGQFLAADSAVCAPTYWSARRFSPEVVEAFDKTIDMLKKKSGAKYVELVGYSGGGALAVLVAAARNDVASVKTIAGNLDIEAFARLHNVSPLTGSMNPADVAAKIKNLPQRHFVGSKDIVVPVSIAQSFLKRAGDADDKRITVVDGATHTKGWQERWPELLAMQTTQ